MKILIIVLSYDDNSIYTKFYNAQKETWDSIDKDGVETYYLFGNHDKDEIIDKKIMVNVQEGSISNCGDKTMRAFSLVKDMDYDYIFRINSSSYVDKHKLLEFVSDKPTEKFYSGKIGNHNNILFASGSGFFLSKDLVNILLENGIEFGYIDDVAIGLKLSQLGYKVQDHPRFDVHDDSNMLMGYFHYRLKTINRDSDIHHMYKLHELKLNEN